MIRADSSYTALEAEILDLSLVLHAEHGGGNNSAFALHVVTSSDTDTYSAIAAAVGSLKGAKHGGANIKVAGMMNDIKANVKDWKNEDEVARYLAKILTKEAFDHSGLIYGIGHAVYTLSDPRAIILREKAEQISYEKSRTDEFGLYRAVEKLAPRVFAEVRQSNKPLAANVDFYSGLVYDMLNIPSELYTPLFAISRIAGWSAHRIEEIVSGGRIIRPAYKSVVKRSSYAPMEKR
jgi:citrate synthase